MYAEMEFLYYEGRDLCTMFPPIPNPLLEKPVSTSFPSVHLNGYFRSRLSTCTHILVFIVKTPRLNSQILRQGVVDASLAWMVFSLEKIFWAHITRMRL